jgi:hypothetical protein
MFIDKLDKTLLNSFRSAMLVARRFVLGTFRSYGAICDSIALLYKHAAPLELACRYDE